MSKQHHIVSLIVVVVVLAMFAGLDSARATILTFNVAKTGEGTTHDDSFETEMPDYGDSVSGTPIVSGPYTYNYEQGNGYTPNIDVLYSHDIDATDTLHVNDSTWSGGVAYLAGTVTGANRKKTWFTFTPDLGYAVRINSFEFKGYPGRTNNITWTIWEDQIGGEQHGGSDGRDNLQVFNASAHGVIVDGAAATFYTGTLVLEAWHTFESEAGTLSIDTINFDQQLIPEPASLGVFAVGTSLTLMRRRSRGA